MNNEALAALFGALIGGVVTGVMTIVANVVAENRRDAKRARHLSIAIAAEILAVTEVVRRRRYVEGIREAEASARAGDSYTFKVPITYEYFPVTESSLVEIGILSNRLASLVPQFITCAKSALEDIRALNTELWEDKEAAELAEAYADLRQMFETALAIGAEIITDVEQTYKLAFTKDKNARGEPARLCPMGKQSS